MEARDLEHSRSVVELLRKRYKYVDSSVEKCAAVIHDNLEVKSSVDLGK